MKWTTADHLLAPLRQRPARSGAAPEPDGTFEEDLGVRTASWTVGHSPPYRVGERPMVVRAAEPHTSRTRMRKRLLPLPLLSVFTTSNRPISPVERTWVPVAQLARKPLAIAFGAALAQKLVRLVQLVLDALESVVLLLPEPEVRARRAEELEPFLGERTDLLQQVRLTMDVGHRHVSTRAMTRSSARAVRIDQDTVRTMATTVIARHTRL